MSPRHFTKVMYGPYYLSDKHYDPLKKPSNRQTFICKVLKYTGIGYIISFFKSRRANKK
jgi:hypothetical protein